MGKITKKQAKKLCLEVWEYLRDHPEIDDKINLPDEIYDKIYMLANECPLCELYFTQEIDCPHCPLELDGEIGLYGLWVNSITKNKRAKYAGLIVDKVKAWQV